MRILFFAICLSILLCYTVTAEEKNYCYDLESNQEWEDIVKKNPLDMNLAALHALRLGLCLKVERGDLSVSQATEIFETLRMQLINKASRERLHKDKRPEL